LIIEIGITVKSVIGLKNNNISNKQQTIYLQIFLIHFKSYGL